MKNLENIHNVYFIGIGGIGMSALARYFHSIGKRVAGYDKTSSPITRDLEQLDIQIVFSDAESAIPKDFLNAAETLVVYTPAVPTSHQQFQYFTSNNFEVAKRAKVLGAITKNTFTLAVAGTHGKTTTSTILAHLLYQAGEKVTAFLGGISENYNSNYISNGDEVVVVEADEFDRSFLQLSPDISAITSMDADHLDIYGAPEALVDSFHEFASLTQKTVYKTTGLPIAGKSIGMEAGTDFRIENIKINNGTYRFDLQTPAELITDIVVTLPGHHNLRNAVTAFVMAMEYGVDVEKLKEGLSTFKGIQRRFSYQINTPSQVFIDDYAHHPTEINALHQAVREMHSGKKVLAIFQPHLYSRTKDFAVEFAKSLAQFDELWLLDIYPARELPIDGVTSQWLLDLVNMDAKKIMTKEDVLLEIATKQIPVVLTVGAGDIGVEVPKIKKVLQHG